MSLITDIKVEIPDYNHMSQVMVYVTSESGHVGVGEAWWGIPSADNPGSTSIPIANVIEHLLAPRLIGKSSRTIEKHWFDLWDYGYRYADEGIFLMGLSGIDIALWDLLGKELDTSVCQLLGGPVHEKIPGYASLPALRDPEVVLSEVKRAMDAGFFAVKLHELDPIHVHNIRREFGNDLHIMVDVNGHFNKIEAIEVGKELAKGNVTWYEEPVRPMRDHAAIKEVGDRANVPIAAGENEYTLKNFEQILQSKALTYLQPEITKIGGITAAKRITGLTGLYNTALSPHNMRIGPALNASIQWGFNSPMTAWQEVPWVRYEFAAQYKLPPVEDGYVLPPTEPGIGLIK